MGQILINTICQFYNLFNYGLVKYVLYFMLNFFKCDVISIIDFSKIVHPAVRSVRESEVLLIESARRVVQLAQVGTHFLEGFFYFTGFWFG